jgi:hypothetical protein
MTRWIAVIVIAALMLCEILFAVPDLFAQSPAPAFESQGLVASTRTARTTTGSAPPTQAACDHGAAPIEMLAC